MFSTTRPGQTALRFRVNQGESPLVINTLYLGEVEVDVTVLSTGVKSSLVIDQLASEMSEADISAALKKMTKLKVHPRSEAANIHLRTRLEAAFAMSKGLGRDFVTALLLRFGAAIEAQDKAARTPLRAELHSTLDQIEAHHVT